MNHKNTLIRWGLTILATLALLLSVDAQKGPRTGAVSIDLRAAYDIWPSDAKLQLKSIYTLADAKAKHADLWRAAVVMKWTDAQVMDMTLFEAGMWDATWKNADFLAMANYPLHGGVLTSRNDIKMPNGAYLTTYPLEYGFGQWEGSGNGVGNAAYAGRSGDTEISPWLANWKGDPKHVVVMRAFHHGSNDLSAYSEGTQLRNFRIDGGAGKWTNPNQVITGIQAWDFGEGSSCTDLMIQRCDTNLNVIRGTPFVSGGILSLFSANSAGMAITGGGTLAINCLSMDDNARAVHSRAGYGRPATLGGFIGGVKSEWFITPEANGRTPKTNTWVLDGWFHLNIGHFTHSIGAAYQDALFVLTPNVNASHLLVQDFRLNGFSQLGLIARDGVNKKAWVMDSGYGSGIQRFEYSNIASGQLLSWPVQAAAVGYPYQGPMLGYLKADPVTGAPLGGFDRTNGLPSWNDVTGSSSAPATAPPSAPLPVDPTPVPPVTPPAATIKWSTSFDGTDPTKLKTGTVINASAFNASWSGMKTLKSGTGTTQGNSIFPVAVAAQKLVLKGVMFASSADYAYLCGSDLNNGVRVRTDGTLLWSSTGQVLGKLPAVKADVEVLFPSPLTLTYVLGMKDGACPVFSVDAYEIW